MSTRIYCIVAGRGPVAAEPQSDTEFLVPSVDLLSASSLCVFLDCPMPVGMGAGLYALGKEFLLLGVLSSDTPSVIVHLDAAIHARFRAVAVGPLHLGLVLKQLQLLRAEPSIVGASAVATPLGGFGTATAHASPFSGAIGTSTTTSTASMADIEAAAFGAMMGAIMGNAIGAHLQDWPKKPSPADLQNALTLAGGGKFSLQPGGVTDPSELMVLLARACATATPNTMVQVIETAAEFYVAWVKTGPLDASCVSAWQCFVNPDGEVQSSIASRGYAQSMYVAGQMNKKPHTGALQRCIPLAIWGYRLSEVEMYNLVGHEARLSNSSESAIVAETAYCLAVAWLIGHPGDRAGAFNRAINWVRSGTSKDAANVLEWLTLAADPSIQLPRVHIPKHKPNLSQSFIQISIVHAFRHLTTQSTYEAAISAVVSGGGDSAVNGTVVGGLLGAAVGLSALPAGHIDTIVRSPVRSVAIIHPQNAQALVPQLLAKAPMHLA